MKFNGFFIFAFFMTWLNIMWGFRFYAESATTAHLVVFIITIAMSVVSLAAVLIDARFRYTGAYDE